MIEFLNKFNFDHVLSNINADEITGETSEYTADDIECLMNNILENVA